VLPLTPRRLGCLALGLALGAALAPGCARVPTTRPTTTLSYEYFTQPPQGDAWSPKIADWQRRERVPALPSVDGTPASVSGSGTPGPVSSSPAEDLRSQYRAFRAEQKRAVARQVAAWIQEQARVHYQADGSIDHWATLSETLARGAEDCDGLELLVNRFLRDAGFREGEVYRAIVFRPADGQHHMVTFWFETPTDPWVIDPTGAMTTGMPHMSELPDWVPLKVFSETQEFSVRTAVRPLP
jgi:predicted transglutaminase-like cysteine proteinase